jgi:hypothetical protein
VERAVGTAGVLYDWGESGRVVETWVDLSRLWDGVALWVALEMVDGVAHGARGPAVSYWPR